MNPICANCKHWQCAYKLRNDTNYADCYFVLGTLNLNLFEGKDERGYYFNVPFDPNDFYRWKENSWWLNEYRKIVKKLPAPLKLDGKFIQTNKEHYCKYYDNIQLGKKIDLYA